jgi:hypothetical protein
VATSRAFTAPDVGALTARFVPDAGAAVQPGRNEPVSGHVTWLSVSGSSIRYAVVGTVLAALAVGAAVLVCVAVPVLIVRNRLASAR